MLTTVPCILLHEYCMRGFIYDILFSYTQISQNCVICEILIPCKDISNQAELSLS